MKFLFIFLFCAASFCAQAAPAPPNCVCEITARVTHVEEIVHRSSDPADVIPPSLELEIEVASVGRMIEPGYSPQMDCSQYRQGQTLKTTVAKDRDFIEKGTVLKAGDVVRGHIQYAADEWGRWYRLDNIVKVSGG